MAQVSAIDSFLVNAADLTGAVRSDARSTPDLAGSPLCPGPGGAQVFWDTWFTKEQQPFDWILPPDLVAARLQVHMQPHMRVLHVGCGNSTLGVQLRQMGHTGDIINTDLSSVAVDQMTNRCECPSHVPPASDHKARKLMASSGSYRGRGLSLHVCTMV